MAKRKDETKRRPDAQSFAAELGVPERVLLFCLASGTDWVRAGVSSATARNMMVKDLVARDRAGALSLTERGREVLAALLDRAAVKD